jgi:hypothetical protein
MRDPLATTMIPRVSWEARERATVEEENDRRANDDHPHSSGFTGSFAGVDASSPQGFNPPPP